MSKSLRITTLIAATIIGSLFAVLASNMFFDDIVNIGGSSTMFVTIPALTFAAAFVVVIFYLLRTYKYPNCMKRIIRSYSIIIAVLGLIGVVGSILAGAIVYHEFFGKHPFPGYVIIFMVLNLCLVSAGVIGFFVSTKLNDDADRVKINFYYVLKTIGWFLFTSLMLNRLGTFLGSPLFIYWRNFHLTFPFYIYLLVPVFIGVTKALYILGIAPKNKLFLLGLIALGVNVALFTYTVIMGLNDTGFISSLSQAMPMERVAGKPVELPIHFLAYTGAAVTLIVTGKKKEA